MSVYQIRRVCVFVLIGATLGMTGVSPASGADGWHTYFDQAAAQAQKTGKLILVDFTGSDWCGWCIKLRQEVFDTNEFKKWASEKVVLLEVDFPRRKKLSAKQTQHNQALAKKYGIKGYPTILLLDAEGQVVGKSGYRQGGASAWISHAQSIVDSAAPKVLRYHTSLLQGQSVAGSKSRPHLVAFLNAHADQAKQDIAKRMLNSSAFVDFANKNLVVTAIVRPASNETPAQELAAIQAFSQKHRVQQVPMEFLLIHPNQEKVLFRTAHAMEPGPFLRAIQAVMPKSTPSQARPGASGEQAWLEDFAKAKAVAAQLNRPMLLDFTGSDWCGWCIKLHQEVFSQPKFKDYAGKNLVLVKVDFPQRKAQSESLKQQNQTLAQQYGIQGFPTLVVLDPAGQYKGAMGYVPGGPGAFLTELRSILD